jgi:methyl-accepting chemotaxis protein
MRFKDWPMAARIWSAIAVTMASFTTAAVVAQWQNDGPARGAPWMLIVALAVAALISGLAGWFVAAGIVKPFHKAVDIAVAIARGQLDNPIRADTRDELGWLLHELKQMQKSLAGSVTGIRAAADAINAVAGEIVSASANLSARTETQAVSLQQASGSMEEQAANLIQIIGQFRLAA